MLRVDEEVDALAGGELAPRPVPLDGGLAAAGSDLRGPRAELLDERGHALAPPREQLAFALDLRGQEHGFGAYRSCK